MQRRHALAVLAGCPAAALAQQDAPRPRHKLSAGELHEALSARFPLRLQLGGLLALQVSAPQLLLAPARQKLGATLQAQLSGVPLPPAPPGELDVVFALRYEASDQSLRGHQMEVLGLRWPGLPPEVLRSLERLVPAIARDAIGEVVLHRFTARELALPDTMGFEPERFVVADNGVEVVFGSKLRR